MRLYCHGMMPIVNDQPGSNGECSINGASESCEYYSSESKGVILVETVGGNGSMGGSAGHGQDGSHGCNTYGGSGEDGRPRKDDNSGANGRNDGSEKNASVGRHVQVLRVYRHLY
ncbi:unnamed protein product [Rotaria sp. Silwood1]|nr:unnamed protein product [Rotaria sp. Silwood1]CAF3489152.1 unnamed protein product [Rotaria sp. Silwood1]CAF3547525.1 unnamed protein product [Rotaria sp. Silwood1]CAF3577859.1 unnamed protein product [Rotaria sp. Silwood1]CAF4637484.1 unnamed protein product [Rotaria sp. Silwood1]